MNRNLELELINSKIADSELEETILNTQVANYIDNIAKNISAVCKKNGITIAELAPKACLTRKAITQILNNRAPNVSFKSIVGLCNAINYSLNDIIK